VGLRANACCFINYFLTSLYFSFAHERKKQDCLTLVGGDDAGMIPESDDQIFNKLHVLKVTKIPKVFSVNILTAHRIPVFTISSISITVQKMLLLLRIS
jgi:hypothetical protein